MRRWRQALAIIAVFAAGPPRASECSVLFVGNSFTFGYGTPVERYRPETVRDLNGRGAGGVPSLFAAFASQSGVSVTVSHETFPDTSLRWHLDRRSRQHDGKWDAVVLQGYSTLNKERPGDPTEHIDAARQLARRMREANPSARVELMSTWSRADHVYPEAGHWHGRAVYAMAEDLYAASRAAVDGSPDLAAVVPVGLAWNRAMREGIADPNPYDGLAPGTVDLWGTDHYHASIEGYYLEALVVFGHLTGIEPTAFGPGERAASDLGIAPGIASALQRVARDELRAHANRPAPVPCLRRDSAPRG